jgi:DNA-binding transcriptional ArsR family regulator
MGTPAIDENVLCISKSDNPEDNIKLNYDSLRRSVLILRAINHDLRQDMIRLLDEEGRMTVTDIYIKLRLEQSVASQHLAILRRSGILKTQRDGKFIYYSLNKARIQDVAGFIEEMSDY